MARSSLLLRPLLLLLLPLHAQLLPRLRLRPPRVLRQRLLRQLLLPVRLLLPSLLQPPR